MTVNEITAKVSGYEAIFEQTATGWSATVPDLPGISTCGDTLEETKENIKEAIELWIESPGIKEEKSQAIAQ